MQDAGHQVADLRVPMAGGAAGGHGQPPWGPDRVAGRVHDPAGHMLGVEVDRERALPGQPVEASAAGVGSMVQDASSYQRARSGS